MNHPTERLDTVHKHRGYNLWIVPKQLRNCAYVKRKTLKNEKIYKNLFSFCCFML